jgi:hypothetical protein
VILDIFYRHGSFSLIFLFILICVYDAREMFQPQPSELKETAMQGIMACLEDATKCLKENKVGFCLYRLLEIPKPVDLSTDEE